MNFCISFYLRPKEVKSGNKNYSPRSRNAELILNSLTKTIKEIVWYLELTKKGKMAKINILLIEDGEASLFLWKRGLQDKGHEPMCVRSIEKAREVFPQKQWDIIVFDGCIGGDDFNSPPLILDFKARSKDGCILIAASRSRELREQMVKAGCTHQSPKEHVAYLITEDLFPGK
jgi:CheY-like chemotaxis protein